VCAASLLACVLFAALRRAADARLHHCPAAPDAASIAAIEAEDPPDAKVSVADATPNFLLIWSTPASSFGLVPRRCLESVFYHHPRAAVTLYSNHLSPPAAADAPPVLRDLFARGYDVRVRPYNLSALLAGTPAAPWLARLSEWRRGPYFYSHVTDALRLALLFRHGGVYLDSDVILVRPLRLAGVAETLRLPPPLGSPYSDLKDALGVESYDAPPPTSLFGSPSAQESSVADDDTDGVRAAPAGRLPMLNGAVLVFSARHSRFLWAAMAEFAASYDPKRWGWNGPELLTRVALTRCAGPGGAPVQVHPPDAFYPIYWRGLERLASAPGGEDGEEQRRAWRRISRRSYAAHLWNRKTAGLALKEGSLLHRLLHTWTVLPAEGVAGRGVGERSNASLAW